MITKNETNLYYKYTPPESIDLLIEAGPEGVEFICFFSDDAKCGSSETLLSVEKFGTVAWKSMKKAFKGCKKMQFASTLDTPDLTNAKEMSYMFSQCTAFNQSLNTWNVSSVTSMGYMFSTCPVFNQDLNAWNVSNVANMKGLFANCTAFNQPLNGWTPIKVTNMAYMFSSCTTFNQPIGSWNVSKVGLMKKYV